MLDQHDTKSIVQTLRGLGLSQSEIARQTGIPQPRISRWEAGEYPESADDSLRLLALMQRLQQDRQNSAA